MVRGAVKEQAASASQVRCTCSMQGLKEQNTPSGRRHASADLATCDTSACASASLKYIRMQCLSLTTFAHQHQQDRGLQGAWHQPLSVAMHVGQKAAAQAGASGRC